METFSLKNFRQMSRTAQGQRVQRSNSPTKQCFPLRAVPAAHEELARSMRCRNSSNQRIRSNFEGVPCVSTEMLSCILVVEWCRLDHIDRDESLDPREGRCGRQSSGISASKSTSLPFIILLTDGPSMISVLAKLSSVSFRLRSICALTELSATGV